MTVRLWHAIMRKGVIEFARPAACIHRPIREMNTKEFGSEKGNFSGLAEFGEVL
jgi:CRISPR-associated protein Cas5d